MTRCGCAFRCALSHSGQSSRFTSESLPSPARSLTSQKLSPAAKRRSASSATAMAFPSPAGMKWKYTFTAPPQIMPRFWTSSLVSEKSCTSDARFSRRSAAICSERYSTLPPPMVPHSRPPAPTSILAPAPRGVAPEDAMTVTSTRSSPALRRSRMILKSFFISLLLFPR